MTQQRRPGRPSSGARAALLDAAEQLFAESGFAGARVDLIAARAGCNKSLIFQYFGDKAALYTAVMQRAEQAAADLRRRALAGLLTLDAQTAPPVDVHARFATAIGLLYDFLAARPQLLRILQWAQAEQRHFPPDVTLVMLDPQLDDRFTFLYRRGLLRSNVPAQHQLADLLLQLQALLSAETLYQRLPLSVALPADRRRLTIIAALTAGLLTDDAHGPRPTASPRLEE